jgi:regulator of sirC expression with transglutaminase-like and TPR domain
MSIEELDALGEFEEAIAGPDEEIDLARAALILAKGEYPTLEIVPYLEQLDELARKVVERFGDSTDCIEQVEALNETLFNELAIKGASDNYYDPRNSYLHEVLDRRVGIPVSLSVVFMGVGIRSGIALAGTAVPMHFLVRVLGVRPSVFVDCYSSGRLLTADQCREGLYRISQGRIPFSETMLDPISNRAVLVRVLTNLKMIHLNALAYDKALKILDRLVVAEPFEAGLLRERGLVNYRLGHDSQARKDLSDYLEKSNEPADAQEIRDLLKRIS